MTKYILGSLKTLILTGLLTAFAGQFTSAVAQRFQITAVDAVWKYKFDSTYQCLDGSNWEQPGFDDSTWSSGPGGFTGGETRAAALIGVNTTTLPAPNSGDIGGRRASFRIHFNLTTVNGLSLTLSNRLDDNVVFFLNGTRIAQIRATDDPLVCGSFGTAAIGPNTDAELWEVINLSADQLAGVALVGDNVLAASVGQNSSTSSDLVFVCAISGESGFAPLCVDSGMPANISINEGGSGTLTTSADGSAPLAFQWSKDGAPITDATNRSYTINNATPDSAGAYSVHVSNPVSSVDCGPAMVTIVPDTTAPRFIYARCGTNANDVIIRLSEPLDNTRPETVNDAFLWKVNTVGGPGGPLTVDAIEYTTGDVNIFFKLSGPLEAGSSYQLVTDADYFDVSAAGNKLPLGSSVLVSCYSNKTLVKFDDVWKYNDSGTSFDGAGWEKIAFDDATWKSGPGVFDGKRGAAGTADVCRNPATAGGVPIGTCIGLSNALSSDGLPSYYFRHKFQANASDSTNLLALTTLLDDGAIFYLNGVELGRVGAADSTLFGASGSNYATYLGGTAVGDPAIATTYFYPQTPLIAGENIITAIVKQVNNTSSDVTFGLELVSIGAFPPSTTTGPTLTIAYSGSDLVITWSPATGILQSKDSITGTWSDVTPTPAAGGPYIVPVVGAAKFYSLRQ